MSPTYGNEAERLAAADDAARSALGDDAFASAHAQGARRSLARIARFATTILTDLEPTVEE